MNKPLSLSDHQLRQIHAAAKALLPLQRSDFVHGVKRRLAITHPTKPCRLRSVPNWHSIAWRRGAGKEDVVPDAPKASGNDAMPVSDIETAYRLYAEEISQAWKTPR